MHRCVLSAFSTEIRLRVRACGRSLTRRSRSSSGGRACLQAPSGLQLRGSSRRGEPDGFRGGSGVVPRWFRGRFRVVPRWFRVVPGGSAPKLAPPVEGLGAGQCNDKFVVSLVFPTHFACRARVVDPGRPAQKGLRTHSKMWCCSLFLKLKKGESEFWSWTLHTARRIAHSLMF